MEEIEMTMNELFIRNHDALKSYCVRLIHYDPRYMPLVDDCIQEAFLKAFHNFESIRSSPNPFGWLAVCCQHYIRSEFRKQKRRSEIMGIPVSLETSEEASDPMDSVLRWLNRMDAKEVLDAITAQLSPAEKKVFRDHFELGHTMNETAERCDMSANAVRSAVERIKKKAIKSKISVIFFIGQCIFHFSRTV